MTDAMPNIIDACRRGSHSAQLKLYKRYASKLYNACLRIVGNSGEAEEAMQDTFLKIFSRIDQYREGENFEAWIQRIAVHTAIDYVRRHDERLETLSDNYSAIDDEAEVQENDEALLLAVDKIRQAAQKLPAGYRVVLSLYLFEGYDMDEISSILKIQPPSVRTQYMRGKRRLLELLTAK
jgi:RNA polymerase sigma-70 factor (ECF subfamily)